PDSEEAAVTVALLRGAVLPPRSSRTVGVILDTQPYHRAGDYSLNEYDNARIPLLVTPIPCTTPGRCSWNQGRRLRHEGTHIPITFRPLLTHTPTGSHVARTGQTCREFLVRLENESGDLLSIPP